MYEHYENYERYIPDVMLKKHKKHEEYLSNAYAGMSHEEIYKSKLGTVEDAIGLIESGDYEKHLNRYKKQSKATRDALIGALDSSSLGSRMSIEEKDSGLHFVLSVESQRSEGTIAQLAREKLHGSSSSSTYSSDTETRQERRAFCRSS